jgi:hypothetical protein
MDPLMTLLDMQFPCAIKLMVNHLPLEIWLLYQPYIKITQSVQPTSLVMMESQLQRGLNKRF